MTSEAIGAMLTRQPFEPMRVTLSRGRTFEIKPPEMASVAKSGLVIVLPEQDGSPSDNLEYCSWLHIASVATAAFA